MTSDLAQRLFVQSDGGQAAAERALGRKARAQLGEVALDLRFRDRERREFLSFLMEEGLVNELPQGARSHIFGERSLGRLRIQREVPKDVALGDHRAVDDGGDAIYEERLHEGRRGEGEEAEECSQEGVDEEGMPVGTARGPSGVHMALLENAHIASEGVSESDVQLGARDAGRAPE